ncbi:glutamine-synthetase adenylyltransferase [Bdellovibrio sp. 22V]|uniref:[protein-PII] uridylyltransferase family protein n=1 Tax=Bdellovibrio TaxID=958 RepID=UPI0025435667|nr:glutamine-synthetase adenylyltransferase [Bdellovibrio sp. 22V]WII70579.1 glutamine-synthetase adenylyltransferase [Bdellovibrio sp. 22V]
MTNLPFEEQVRNERNEIWSRCALAAKNNSLPPDQICKEWSASSDLLLQKAFQQCFPQEGVALFALGKLGSEELNLSSDVDLLFVSQNENTSLLSSLRRFQKILNDRTAQGFVFRVDFDLRPGGKQGPLIPTLDQFKDYYGNYGETWERLAFVRLRPLCGDAKIQNEVVSFAKKFSFRKHLDFTLLEDLKSLRSKIQNHYWTRTQEDVVDLKLGIGGIRDVELFTHALQVIHGGKDSSLQVHGTSEALLLLEGKNILPSEEAQFLRDHYWNLRRLENYVQALHDEQTHLLKTQDSHPGFVTAAMTKLNAEMNRCDQIVKSLLGEAPEEVSLEEELQKTGISEADLEELWQEILDQQVLSRNKGRDEAARKAFLSAFLETLQEQKGDIRRGLLLLKDFIRGTRAKATFFSLLLREKALLEELAWLFGHSPYLSRILCNRPELLDSFVYRAQDKPAEDLGTLLEELAEKRLLSEVINGSAYLEDKDLSSLVTNLTSTADAIVESLLNALKKDYPSEIRILALGKWGGQELGFRSDLDFIFVVPDEPSENDFKISKRFITRLTEAHRGGNIYNIDMRLRPSGKAGPIVISEKDLREYLATEAGAWERQAYLKARWIGNSSHPMMDSFISRGLSTEELQELEKIRLQLISTSSAMNLKFSEGGLVDIELAAQTFVLFNKVRPLSSSTRDLIDCLGHKASALKHNYERLRQIEQMLQLVASESLLELQLKHESFQALALALHLTPSALQNEVAELLAANITLLKELDPRRQPH